MRWTGRIWGQHLWKKGISKGYREICWECQAKGRTMLEVSLGVGLLVRCDRAHNAQGDVYSTNSCGKLHWVIKSQSSPEKMLENHSLVTKDYFLHFWQESSLEGIQTSILMWKVKEHFVQSGIPGHCQGYNISVALNENQSMWGIFSEAPWKPLESIKAELSTVMFRSSRQEHIRKELVKSAHHSMP